MPFSLPDDVWLDFLFQIFPLLVMSFHLLSAVMIYRFCSDMQLFFEYLMWFEISVKNTQKLNRAEAYFGLVMAFSLELIRNEGGLRVAHSHLGEDQPFLLATVLAGELLSLPCGTWKVLELPPQTSSYFLCFLIAAQVGHGSRGWTKTLEPPRLGLRSSHLLSHRAGQFMTSGLQPPRLREVSNWEFSIWPVIFLQKVRRLFNIRNWILRHQGKRIRVWSIACEVYFCIGGHLLGGFILFSHVTFGSPPRGNNKIN